MQDAAFAEVALVFVLLQKKWIYPNKGTDNICHFLHVPHPPPPKIHTSVTVWWQDNMLFYLYYTTSQQAQSVFIIILM